LYVPQAIAAKQYIISAVGVFMCLFHPEVQHATGIALLMIACVMFVCAGNFVCKEASRGETLKSIMSSGSFSDATA